jgi:hypothetical protein
MDSPPGIIGMLNVFAPLRTEAELLRASESLSLAALISKTAGSNKDGGFPKDL